LSLINGAGHELWRSESLPDQHGRMIRGFKSDNEVVLQMEDLSLHYIANGRMMWHLEEGLSQIKQVEVFDKSTVEEMDNGLPTYVASMSDKDIPIAEIPMRIMQRYLGNLQHLSEQF